ncbi:hypothetical protein LY78DRAFT_685642 [Colletotrichum sublineola]|nr:hypothetical protein LY78DRAFT_685642 [Colletotrichum sublineola]
MSCKRTKAGRAAELLNGEPADTPDYQSPDKSTPVQSPEVSVLPWYEGQEEDKADKSSPTSAQGAQHITNADASKTESNGRPATGLTTPPSSSSPLAMKDYDRPLVLYAFAESDAGRENLKFFKNIRVINRPNTCFDLGAYGEVLRKDDLYKKYKRFITLNASIPGPFLPHWARSCWSDLYLGRLSEKVKDGFGTENDAVGMGGCHDGWNQAVHAEVGAISALLKQGYKVDMMMAAFQKSKNYIEECDTSQSGNLLWNGKYFGTYVHPYETVFIKANRDIDPTLIEHLATWQQASGFNSYSVCKAAP